MKDNVVSLTIVLYMSLFGAINAMNPAIQPVKSTSLLSTQGLGTKLIVAAGVVTVSYIGHKFYSRAQASKQLTPPTTIADKKQDETATLQAPVSSISEPYSNFYEWQEVCNVFCKPSSTQTPLTSAILLSEIEAFCALENSGALKEPRNWLQEQIPGNPFLTLLIPYLNHLYKSLSSLLQLRLAFTVISTVVLIR